MADGKDKGIKAGVKADGDSILMFTGESSPLVGLSSQHEEGKDPSADLVLADADQKAGIVLSGKRSGSFIRLKDRRQEVRASLELAANGEPELYIFDEDNRHSNGLERVVGAVLFSLVLILGAILGALVAGSASSTAGLAQVGTGPFRYGSLAGALLTLAVLALLVGYLIQNRR